MLAGDANRDRTVNFNDLVALAQNYNTSGKTFSTGDFNADGGVDFQDLVLLAQRYNTTLPPPPAAASSPAAVQRRQESVFGTAASGDVVRKSVHLPPKRRIRGT